MFEIYTIENCPYCMNTLMTLEKYRLPYHQINVTEDEKDYYKKVNDMPSFPQIFLINESSNSNRRKIKVKKQNKVSAAAIPVKSKIGSDQDFQVLVRFAVELKNKKIDLSMLQNIQQFIR